MECRELHTQTECESSLLANNVQREQDIAKVDNETDTARFVESRSINKDNIIYSLVKRSMDIVLSLLGGFIFFIPLVFVCLAIIVKDFGNPFYVQSRVGKDGKKFALVKLRSMKKHADNVRDMLDAEQLEHYYSEYKLDDDPRLIGWNKKGDGVRCFGAWIRKLSMDELPQIYWNILIKGNMSVVGPRPILQEELERHYSKAEQERLLSIKPGLTGYWQAYARNNATYETGERQKMELYYAEHRCLWLDVKILFATVGAVLSKSGAK